MFKKVNRNFENKYGIINSNGDFPNRPCILGIVPMSSNLKLFNGYMNLYMYMLQIRRSKDIDSSYDIKDVPFDLLMRNYKDDVVSIVLKNIPANNIMEAKMIMRNINIISYCNGNNETG